MVTYAPARKKIHRRAKRITASYVFLLQRKEIYYVILLLIN